MSDEHGENNIRSCSSPSVPISTTFQSLDRDLQQGVSETVRRPEKGFLSRDIAIEALIELACRAHRGAHWRAMYSLVRQRLTELSLLPPSVENLEPLRAMYQRLFSGLLVSAAAASSAVPHTDNAISGRITRPIPLFSATSLSQHIWSLATDASLLLSRFRTDFEPLCLLGRGAFAAVCSCRSRIDSQVYAVKRVLFSGRSTRTAIRTIREVSVLASLSHPNVVRYHTAWLEPLIAQRSSNDHHIQHGLNTVESNSNRSVTTIGDSSSLSTAPDVDITFDTDRDISSESWAQSREKVSTQGRFWASNGSSNDSYSRLSINGGINDKPVAKRSIQRCVSVPVGQPGFARHYVCLYIQMQLCDSTLRQWLRERNVSVMSDDSTNDRFSLVDAERCLRIAIDLLSAVSYIHKHDVVHRDIKPENIFFDGQDHVLLGDFGLARSRKLKHKMADSDSVSSSKLDITTKSPTVKFRNILPGRLSAIRSYSADSTSAVVVSSQEVTSGVGTAPYAAPEQLSGIECTSAADMFSVGLVLLELFYPFGTETQRRQMLWNLRKDSRMLEFESEFCARFPVVANAVMLLTSYRPHLRPSATTVSELLKGTCTRYSTNIVNSTTNIISADSTECVDRTRTNFERSNASETSAHSHKNDACSVSCNCNHHDNRLSTNKGTAPADVVGTSSVEHNKCSMLNSNSGVNGSFVVNVPTDAFQDDNISEIDRNTTEQRRHVQTDSIVKLPLHDLVNVNESPSTKFTYRTQSVAVSSGLFYKTLRKGTGFQSGRRRARSLSSQCHENVLLRRRLNRTTNQLRMSQRRCVRISRRLECAERDLARLKQLYL